MNIIENIEVTDAGAEGVAIAKKDGIVIFVKNAVPGDIVDLKIIKKKRKYYEGIIEKIHKKGEIRSEAFCSHYGICGGCKWQHMSYKGQLIYKQKQVTDAFNRIAGIYTDNILPIIPSPNTIEYRNKMEYTFSCNGWLKDFNPKANEQDKLALGFHIAGMFNKVIDINKCYLQNNFANTLRNYIRELAFELKLSFYNVKELTGFLRNIIIRNTIDNQWMLVVVFGYEDIELQNIFLEKIKNKFSEITSLMYVINTKRNDTINDLSVKLYSGLPYITEKMHHLNFKIGPVSFYQTNPLQAVNLYSVVKEFAGLTGNETVYDLYTGTGTIANFVANKSKKVIGIDNIEPAIKDAIQNSLSNNINNTSFIAGDLAKIFINEFIENHSKPDVVITDPPRSGMHPKIIERLLEVLPEKIVYVSCNPATQARDISMLTNYYKVKKMQAVDMFPQTSHVENVALLIKN